MPVLKSDHFKNKLQAAGLIEILIAMTIFAVAIITITSLNAKNFRVIKNNELIDQSNKLMVSSMEFFKSPAQEVQEMIAPATNIPPFETPYSYRLSPVANRIDPAIPNLNIEVIDWDRIFPADTFNSTTDCNAGSAQRVYFGSVAAKDGFLLCMQVDVVRKPAGFLITSKIIYYVNGIKNFNSIIGFRPYTFLNDKTP